MTGVVGVMATHSQAVTHTAVCRSYNLEHKIKSIIIIKNRRVNNMHTHTCTLTHAHMHTIINYDEPANNLAHM